MRIDVSLSKRELDIMKVMWSENKSLTASYIAKKSNISISTVHTAINKLLIKNMIVVDEIIYSGKVLCRCYKPTISAVNYDMRKLANSFQGIVDQDFSTSNFVSALLGQEKDNQKILSELDDLEKMIKEKKEELMKASNSDVPKDKEL